MVRYAHGLMACVLMLTGCAANVPLEPPVIGPAVSPIAPSGWTATLQAADGDRLTALTDTWNAALALARKRYRTRVGDEGALLDPAAALPAVALPPGPYHCRLVRIGGEVGYARFAPDFCYVEAREAGMSFDKQTGATRFEGWLLPDGDTRMGFTGSTRASAARPAPGYGRDPKADVAAIVERVGPFRWRMVLLRPGRGGATEIYELVPVTPPVPGATPAVPASG